MKRQEGAPTTNQAYLADVTMPKNGRPYSVYVFLGDVTGSADQWAAQKSFVSLVSTLGTPSEQPGHGSVELTEVLEKKIEAGETTAGKAVDYLKANLKWRLIFVSNPEPSMKIVQSANLPHRLTLRSHGQTSQKQRSHSLAPTSRNRILKASLINGLAGSKTMEKLTLEKYLHLVFLFSTLDCIWLRSRSGACFFLYHFAV